MEDETLNTEQVLEKISWCNGCKYNHSLEITLEDAERFAAGGDLKIRCKSLSGDYIEPTFDKLGRCLMLMKGSE